MYKIKELPISERPREKLEESGVNNLSDKELLAIILKSGTKNKNVNEIAIEILKKYSLEELKSIDYLELTTIKGIGIIKAMELVASIELGKRIFLEKKATHKKRYSSSKIIWQDMKYLFNGLNQECFYVLYFNQKQELIAKKMLFMGTINKSIVHMRDIFREAFKVSASSIICIHNHPSNDKTPSKEDDIFTKKLVELGMLHQIVLLDHIIFTESDYFSYFENMRL